MATGGKSLNGGTLANQKPAPASRSLGPGGLFC